MAKLRQVLVLTAIIMISAFSLAMAQTDSTDTATDSGITLSAKVENTEVPMNRTVNVVLTLEWYGNLDRYEIFQFDNPILNNFEIVANSSSNKVATMNGRNYAIREYTFTLQPQSLGMGYVESVIIRYTDLDTDSDLTLTTNRIEIKVTDPVNEPGDKTWLIWPVLAVLLIGAGVVLLLNMKKRKAEALAREQEEAEKNRPVEEVLLEELKAGIKLDDPAVDVMQGISTCAKVLKKLLSEKYEIAVESKPTDDIVKALGEKDVSEGFCNDVKEILVTTDILKFSGNQATKQELERIYGMVDTILYKSLRGDTGTSLDVNEENE